MMHTYKDTDDDLVTTFGTPHDNGEQTHIAVVSCGEDDYVALAYDVFPPEYRATGADVVAYGPTLEGVVTRAERWMQANPKGVAPADNGDGGGGAGGKMKALLSKVNDAGNDWIEQTQQRQQGGPKQ